jgi:hypothetical protein
VVRLQDQSSKGETSNSSEELWIARFIRAIVENTTIRETERQRNRRTDGQTDRETTKRGSEERYAISMGRVATKDGGR